MEDLGPKAILDMVLKLYFLDNQASGPSGYSIPDTTPRWFRDLVPQFGVLSPSLKGSYSLVLEELWSQKPVSGLLLRSAFASYHTMDIQQIEWFLGYGNFIEIPSQQPSYRYGLYTPNH